MSLSPNKRDISLSTVDFSKPLYGCKVKAIFLNPVICILTAFIPAKLLY